MPKLIFTIFPTLFLLVISCGPESLDFDPNNHCVNIKYPNNVKTCSKYNLIKPDEKPKKNSSSKAQYKEKIDNYYNKKLK